MEYNPSSNYMLVANPGSGKTHQLSEAICDYIKQGVSPEDMLCITFTERAADEMEKRIFQKLMEYKISSALPEVHTFHSYAFSVLNNGNRELRVISDNLARYAVMRSIVDNKALNYPKETILNDEYGSIPTVGKFVNAIRYIKSYGVTPNDINPISVMRHLEEILGSNYSRNWEKYEEQLNEAEHLLKFFQEAFRDYEKVKSTDTIDYEDMLIEYLKLSQTRKYRYVFVDELQDINDMEARIIDKSGEKFFLVGDVKQAIFGFQGGNVRNFRRFSSEKSLNPLNLVRNFRSGSNLVSYAKEFFLKNVPDPQSYHELPDYASATEEKGEISRIITRKPEISILDSLKYLKDKVPQFSEEKTAIIVRNNAQADRITHMLDINGIDYESTSSSRFSFSARRDIVTFLRGFIERSTDSLRECIFSPFSGFTLKEAFEICRIIQYKNYSEAISIIDLTEFVKKLERYGKDHTGIEDLFQEIIIPKSVAMGKKYYNTAKGMYKSTTEYFDEINGTLDSYMDFLRLANEGQIELTGKSNLVVTTVHKAKGLEFDNVIYWPVQTSNRRLSTLDSVVNAILASRGITSDESELSLENLRVDFVAVTRAKQRLLLVVDPKAAQRFEVGTPEVKDLDLSGQKIDDPFKSRHILAYSLFVEGRYEEAKAAMEGRMNWLREAIGNYFSSPGNISHSLLSKVDRPMELLKQYILRVPFRSESMDMGTKIHTLIEAFIRSGGKKVPENPTPEEKMAFDNFLTFHNSVMSQHKVGRVEAEAAMNSDAESVFSLPVSGLKVKGFIDAIYSFEENGEQHYIIVDFKTSRRIEEELRYRKNSDSADTNYRRQLSLYRKMLSVQRGVKEENIETIVLYVYLRPAVNTGKIDMYVDTPTYHAQHFEFERRKFQRFLEYREDNEKFIEDVRNDSNNFGDILGDVILEELNSTPQNDPKF
ncbi:hypothetical protein IX51_09120 [uncultured archaeon]|nr:hypothetical protein IX51_09120 [uncultured archaeon]